MTIASKSYPDIASARIEPVQGTRKPGIRPIAGFDDGSRLVLRRFNALMKLGRGSELAGVVTKNRQSLHQHHEWSPRRFCAAFRRGQQLAEVSILLARGQLAEWLAVLVECARRKLVQAGNEVLALSFAEPLRQHHFHEVRHAGRERSASVRRRDDQLRHLTDESPFILRKSRRLRRETRYGQRQAECGRQLHEGPPIERASSRHG